MPFSSILLRNNFRSIRLQPLRTTPIRTRSIYQTSALYHPKKNDQDRESINTERTEYTKSGTDESAAQNKQAFDPQETSPEKEKEKGGDSLDISPANKEVSKQGGQETGSQVEKRSNEGKRSGSGSPPKSGV